VRKPQPAMAEINLDQMQKTASCKKLRHIESTGVRANSPLISVPDRNGRLSALCR